MSEGWPCRKWGPESTICGLDKLGLGEVQRYRKTR